MCQNWKQYYELLQINLIPHKRKLWLRGFGGFWDADHIVTVKDGGGDCSLDNIRTLCIQCHKKIRLNNEKNGRRINILAY